ncbi:MAG: hypothetical protein ACPH97_02435 [Flavobacteriales bacterium]
MDLWLLLTRAVEERAMTPDGAQAVRLHVERHGTPVAPEEAWSIEGLGPEEQSWLAASESWHAYVAREAENSAGAKPRTRMALTTQSGWGTVPESWTEARIQSKFLRGRVRWADTLRMDGAVSSSAGRWTWVLGDHHVGWGCGLTVPRSDPFGLALFLGRSEVLLPQAPAPLVHSEFLGGLRGAVVEREMGSWTGGVSLGHSHVATSVRRAFQGAELGWSAFREHGEWTAGADFRWRSGRLDGQAGVAWSPNGVTARGSFRIAQGPSWLLQGAADVWHFKSWQAEFRGYGTWQHRESGSSVQTRVRRHSESIWDVRSRASFRKDAPWVWTFWGREEVSMVGAQFRSEDVRIQAWLGRDNSGAWSYARSVEVQATNAKGSRWGAYGMDGHGDWDGAYVSTPHLDARRWGRAPTHGWRMGIWYRAATHRNPSWGARGWSTLFSWSPSQQEAFRCAVRWRWEA